MFTYQVDDDIYLRMLAVKDAEALFNITNQSRDTLKQWLPWVSETRTIEDSLAFIKNGFQIHAERKGLTAGVFYKGELAGIVSYNSFDWTNRIATIGYWLDTHFQGAGIMTRSVAILTDYAVKTLHMNRIEIRVAPNNIKSQAIPIRLGFEREGHLRQTEWLYDHYVDHLVFSMLAEDWLKK